MQAQLHAASQQSGCAAAWQAHSQEDSLSASCFAGRHSSAAVQASTGVPGLLMVLSCQAVRTLRGVYGSGQVKPCCCSCFQPLRDWFESYAGVVRCTVRQRGHSTGSPVQGKEGEQRIWIKGDKIYDPGKLRSMPPGDCLSEVAAVAINH